MKTAAALVLALLPALATAADLSSSLLRIGDMHGVWEHGRSATSFTMDNDSFSFVPNNGDKYYTSGLFLSYGKELKSADLGTRYAVRIGQEMYTGRYSRKGYKNYFPQSWIDADRPTTSWLFVGAEKEVSRPTGESLTMGFDFGCIGPCAYGEQVQNGWHRKLGIAENYAWDRQLGQEVGFILRGGARTKTIGQGGPFDISAHTLARFGNIHTDLAVGLLGRAHLPALGEVAKAQVFARLDRRFVGYNATLQGGYFSKGEAYAVEPERQVDEAEVGIMLTSNSWDLAGSVVRRTSENARLTQAQGSQNFGRITVTYRN